MILILNCFLISSTNFVFWITKQYHFTYPFKQLTLTLDVFYSFNLAFTISTI